MDMEMILNKADFSTENDFKNRLYNKLAMRNILEDGELDDETAGKVVAARGNLSTISSIRRNFDGI